MYAILKSSNMTALFIDRIGKIKSTSTLKMINLLIFQNSIFEHLTPCVILWFQRFCHLNLVSVQIQIFRQNSLTNASVNA